MSGAMNAERLAHLRGIPMRDASVYLLDWRWSMAQPVADGDGLVPLACALRAVAGVLKHKIIASESDRVGVVAFGAGQAGQLHPGSSTKWPGVRVIAPLGVPSAEVIVRLQALALRLERKEAVGIQAGDADPRLQDPNFSFGKDASVNFDQALWAVRHQYAASRVTSATTRTVYNRCRVYVLTNDADPSRGTKSIRERSIRSAKDLLHAGVAVDVMFLRSRSDITFDSSLFFLDIVHLDEDDWERRRDAICTTPLGSMEELQCAVRAKEVKKRATARLPFRIGDGVTLGVAFYSLVRKATRPAKVNVRSSDMRRLHSVRTTFCSATGESLKPEHVRHTFDNISFLRSNVCADAAETADGVNGDGSVAPGQGASRSMGNMPWGFTSDELQRTSASAERGLQLYGFRDDSVLRAEDMMRPAYFVYPDENSYTGSTRLFVALHRSMLRKRKLALVRFSSPHNSRGPRFGFLLAQQERVGDDGQQSQPPGMHFFDAPYRNDIYVRWRDELDVLHHEFSAFQANQADDDALSYSQSLSTAASHAGRVMKRLCRPNVTLQDFADPDLQRFYAGLELEAGVSEGYYEPEDATLDPLVTDMRRRLKLKTRDSVQPFDVLAALRDETMGDQFDADVVAKVYGSRSGKLDLERTERNAKRKKEADAKRETALENVNIEEFRSASENGILHTYTVAMLKEYCVAFGLRLTGTKAQFVERVSEHIDGKAHEIV